MIIRYPVRLGPGFFGDGVRTHGPSMYTLSIHSFSILLNHFGLVDIQIYSVMQSDGNSFCGDVVLGSFNVSYRDEDSILEQMYYKQISWDLNYEDFIFLK